MIKIQLNEKYVIKAPLTGNPDFDQNAFDYRSNLLVWGCPTKKVGSLIQMELVNGVSLDLNDFQFIMSKDNGEVYDFRPWVKMLPADLQQLVPEGIPNRTKQVLVDDTDPENPIYEEQVKTWDEWIGVNYTKDEIEGYVYFLTNAGTTRGVALTGTELMIIYNLTYAELVTKLPTVEEIV